MIDHDRLFKELLTTFFSEFIDLFLAGMSSYLDRSSLVFLDKEIFSDVTSGEAHEADLVVKARFKNSQSFFLIHTETQAQPQSEFGGRLFRYFARLHEKHGLPVYPIAILSFDRPKSRQPSRYEISFPDLDVLCFRYVVIQLNRLDWRQYLGRPNPVAAALMSKMPIAHHERARVKLECLRMLATLKLDRARVRMISGFVDNYLRLSGEEIKQYESEVGALKEREGAEVMEIVTSWMEDGIKKGRQQEAGSLVVRLLHRRLGTLEESLVNQIQALPLEQLEMLTDALLDFTTVYEVRQWLDIRDRA